MYYHVSYDEVPTDEAIDLCLTLPRGSLYIAKKHPEYSWSEERELISDIQDLLIALSYAARGIKDAPKITRPSDLVERKRALEQAQQNKQRIQTTQWEAIEE